MIRSLMLTGICLCSAGASQSKPPPVSPPVAETGTDPFDEVLNQAADGGGAGYGTDESLIAVHGFLDFKYLDYDAVNSGFDLHHANLFVSGQVSERVEAHIEVEYEHASESIELDQAELRLRPLEHHDLILAAGRFYAPFGIERDDWYPPSSPLVSRPQAFRVVVPGNWYDTGVRAGYRRSFGDLHLRGELALSNGLGATANTDIRGARQFRDNNNSRAVIGRVGLGFEKGPTLGVSGATMRYGDDGDDIAFLGVDLEYRWDPLLLRAEWVESRVEDSGGAVGDFTRRGFYAMASYRALTREQTSLDLRARVEAVDPNSKIDANNDLMLYSVGARLGLYEHFSTTLEYQIQDARHGLSAASEHALLVRFVVEF